MPFPAGTPAKKRCAHEASFRLIVCEPNESARRKVSLARPLLAALPASILASVLATAPALAAPETRTELIALNGERVDQLDLAYAFDGVWVVDNQNLLYRDTSGSYNQVTLKAACNSVIRRNFNFFPSLASQLLATTIYEVRPEAGPRCGVAKIEKLRETKSIARRDASRRRDW